MKGEVADTMDDSTGYRMAQIEKEENEVPS
jgi:hypothetical protein